MLLNKWNQWFFMIGLILIGFYESNAQYATKPLSELDRLPNWFPIEDSYQFQYGLPEQFKGYTSFDDLLQKVKSGSKIEALQINGSVLEKGGIAKLRALQQVRVLSVMLSNSTPQQFDSLIQVIQNWPTLERLTYSIDPAYGNKTGSVQIVALPTGLARLPKLHDVRLGGASFNWDESLKTLVELKTLRYLEVSRWQTTPQQRLKLGVLLQLTKLKISGQGWLFEPETFAGVSQLSELTLSNVKMDTTTFQRSLASLSRLETISLESMQSLRNLKLSELKNLKSVDLVYNSDLEVTATTFVGLTNLERLVSQGSKSFDWSGICAHPQLRTLIVSGNNFRDNRTYQLPDCIGQLDQLTELRLESISFNRLPAQISALHRLQKLSLSNCKLDSLPASVGQLTALEELLLQGNRLQSLPFIGQLKGLRQLHLSNNQLSVLPDDISQLTQLNEIDVSQNKLTQFPNSLARLVNLQNLNLGNNQLEQLPDDIGKLRRLKVLSLYNNQLTGLPTSIGQLDSLNRLTIGKNRLRSFPVSFTRLTNLKSLQIGANELTALPADIGILRQLTELQIEQLPISELPASIGNLVNLQTLHISFTRLRLLPENIGELTKLRSVFLSDNELIALPNSIGGWKEVTDISLDGNKLEGLPNTIGRLHKLTSLRISSKKDAAGGVGGIVQLPDSIVHCTKLQNMTIQNQPQLDGDDVFAKTVEMKSLKRLTIINCGISTLPAIDWKKAPWQSLILSNNLLTELPVSILDAPALENFSVQENRLPEALNRSFNGKDALRVAFIEAGLLQPGSISKPNRKVAMAYQNMAMDKFRQRDWDGAFSDLDKAIDYAPDTIRSFSYALRAGFHMYRKEYTEALTDYDKAIQFAPQLRTEKYLDTLNANRMVASFWQQKAAVFGAMGQYDPALSAITKAEVLISTSNNHQQIGQILTEQGRYLTMKNKLAEADSSYRKAIRAYEKLIYADPGIRLTIVELSLLTGQYTRAKQALANLPTEQLRDGYATLKEYLETCLAVLTNEQSTEQATERFTAYLTKHPVKIYGWSFDLFDNWLARGKFPIDKATALRQLTDATKERLVKPE
ncbi:leucine-rich repeat domain-containing protein [Spirosoma litoris]